MSREGSGPNDTGDEGEDVSTEDNWPPFENENTGASGDWNLEERRAELERKEEVLKDKEEELRDREREIDKRERKIEQREQEVLDRREEIVDERDRIEEKEKQLQQKEQEIEEKASQLQGREEELQEMRDGIDEKLSGAGAGDAGPVFSKRPRRAAALLLALLGVGGLLAAPAALMLGGNLSGPLTTLNGIVPFDLSIRNPPFTAAYAGGLAAILGVGALVEFIGAFFAARGRFWLFTIATAIIGMMLFFPLGVSLLLGAGAFELPGILVMFLLLPIGLTATVFLAIGESQFA